MHAAILGQIISNKTQNDQNPTCHFWEAGSKNRALCTCPAHSTTKRVSRLCKPPLRSDLWTCPPPPPAWVPQVPNKDLLEFLVWPHQFLTMNPGCYQQLPSNSLVFLLKDFIWWLNHHHFFIVFVTCQQKSCRCHCDQLLLIICPNIAACVQLFLVPYSFFVFCCSRRRLSRCKHCRVLGPSWSQFHFQGLSAPTSWHHGLRISYGLS